MNKDDFNIAQSIGCRFRIIQSPDLEHLRIKITPTLPDSYLDDFMLSLKLYPNLSTEKAKQLEDLLNECAEALWVNRKKQLEPALAVFVLPEASKTKLINIVDAAGKYRIIWHLHEAYPEAYQGK